MPEAPSFEVSLRRYGAPGPAHESLVGDAELTAAWCRAVADELDPPEVRSRREWDPAPQLDAGL